MTNRFANPMLARLLASRAGRWFGRRLALLRYEGRRSGVRRQLVTQYVRAGDVAWIVVGSPGSKTWWRNFRDGALLDICLAGEQYRAWAVALDGSKHTEEVTAGLRAYAVGAPKAAKALGLRIDAQAVARECNAAVRDVACRTVMVRVELAPDRR